MVSRRSFLAGGTAAATLNPDGKLIGRTSLYSLYVNTQGAIGG